MRFPQKTQLLFKGIPFGLPKVQKETINGENKTTILQSGSKKQRFNPMASDLLADPFLHTAGGPCHTARCTCISLYIYCAALGSLTARAAQAELCILLYNGKQTLAAAPSESKSSASLPNA